MVVRGRGQSGDHTDQPHFTYNCLLLYSVVSILHFGTPSFLPMHVTSSVCPSNNSQVYILISCKALVCLHFLHYPPKVMWLARFVTCLCLH